MPRDVPWIPEGFSSMWQLSSNYKKLTEPDKTGKKSSAFKGGGMDMNADVCLKNMIKESRAVGPLLPCIFQILDKVDNVIQVHGMSSKPSWGILLGILFRVVLPSSLNPDPTVSDHKMSFSTPVFVYSQLLLVTPVINKNCCIVNLLNIPQRFYCQVEYH